MSTWITKITALEKSPRHGLLPTEWLVVGYTALTLIITLLTLTKLPNPQEVITLRLCVLVILAIMWAVYRLAPCRLTYGLRVIVQLVMLIWWYPDTYEFNRMLPNLDHLFAAAEQSIFGFQPALTFAAAVPSVVFSELMSLGYASYYPLIGLVVIFYFFARHEEFERCAFVVLASFFVYYIVFMAVPVAGPTFYFKAVGVDTIKAGIFPNVYYYFSENQQCLTTPGFADGIFYQMVEGAKAMGERPTAAFPSSHVGISTVIILLVARSRNRVLMCIVAPLYVLMCLSTVYIQAHYAIDAVAGLISGLLLYLILMPLTKPISSFARRHRRHHHRHNHRS